MKRFLVTGLVWGAALMSLQAPLFSLQNEDLKQWFDVEASCKRPPQGPPGPQGAPGPQGPQGPQGPAGSLAINYASSFSTTPFTIGSSTPNFIPFNLDQVPPVGVTHPVGSDTSMFQILNSGVYLLTYTMSLVSTGATTVNIDFFNTTTGLPISPSPFETTGFSTIPNSASGQTTLFITGGTTIQLRITRTAGNSPFTINNPSFTITQISL